MRRPLVSRPYLGAWIVLLWSAYQGFGPIGISLWPPGFDPSGRHAINYNVYHYAAEALLAGEDIYSVHPPGQTEFYVFLYPPITVLGFVPFTVFDSWTGFLVFTAITILVCGAAAVAIAKYLDGFGLTLGWIDIAIIWLFFVTSAHSTGTINFGNVNLILAAGLVFGFLFLDRGREITAGTLFGLVALLKVFPALVGLYLLRVRSWYAIAGATAVGGGGLLASAIVFGPRTVYRFFFEVLFPRSATARFVGGYAPDDTYYVTIQRPLSHVIWTVWPDAPMAVLPIVAAITLGLIVGYCYLDLQTRTDHLVAIHATLTGTVIFMPSLRWYLALVFVSWVALLYVWHDSPLLPLFVLGGLITTITERPSTMVERAEAYPGPIATIMESVYAVGTMQLYGLLLMLLVCVAYNWRRGVGVTDAREAISVLRGELAHGIGTVRARVRSGE